MKRYLGACALIIALVSCSKENDKSRKIESTTAKEILSEKDSRKIDIEAVYSSIINSDSDYVKYDPLICIHEEYVDFPSKSNPNDFKIEVLKEIMGISDETIDALLKTKRQPSIVDLNFDLRFKHILYLKNRDSLPTFSWTITRNKFNKKSEHIRFSRVGFNESRTQALVRTEILDGRFSYGYGTYYLIKSNGKWIQNYGNIWYDM